MRGIPAQHGLKKCLFLAFAVAGGLSLAACSDIDSLFSDESEMAAYDAPTAADAGAPPMGVPFNPVKCPNILIRGIFKSTSMQVSIKSCLINRVNWPNTH